MRPFLPPLLAGALARGDMGIDFEGSDWSFLESPGFLAAVLGLSVLSYALERSSVGRRSIDLLFGAVAVALGALLFAGSLAEGGRDGWIGLAAGAACAALGYVAAASLFGRVRRRLDRSTSLLPVYADVIALALAAAAIVIPPVSILALAAFAYVIVAGRRREGEKYEGLRVLR